MSKPFCEICQQMFKDEEGLAQHRAAKHPAPVQHQHADLKKLKQWGIRIGIVGIVLALVWWGFSSLFKETNACSTMPASQMNIGGHQNLRLHIHADLSILINGKQQLIPLNIGIAPGIMRPLHTHDSTGHIHIEGPCPRDFTLQEFFEIWGKRFDEQCIFEHCTDKGRVSMKVNGKESTDFDKHVLSDGENIVIEYVSQ